MRQRLSSCCGTACCCCCHYARHLASLPPLDCWFCSLRRTLAADWGLQLLIVRCRHHLSSFCCCCCCCCCLRHFTICSLRCSRLGGRSAFGCWGCFAILGLRADPVRELSLQQVAHADVHALASVVVLFHLRVHKSGQGRHLSCDTCAGGTCVRLGETLANCMLKVPACATHRWVPSMAHELWFRRLVKEMRWVRPGEAPCKQTR
jgi:hypothetical protein